MEVSITIQNADNDLINAIKSVCNLHSEAKLTITKQKTLVEELVV